MNVTDKGIKCCQPQGEGSLQRDSPESEMYAGVHDSLRITENNITDANESKEGLLEQILDRNNLNNAFKRVKSNKGAHGVDGIGVNELLQYLKDNGEQLKQSILDGKYRPNPVRRVEIPKEDGKQKRKGYWRISNSPILAQTLNNATIKGFGFIFFIDYYRQVTA